MDTAETVRRVLQERIAPKGNLIKAIYPFGSYSKSKEKAKSDIDLAFVFDERFYKEDPFGALQEAELLGAEISKKIHKKEYRSCYSGMY
jgi:predicted nucleotidyltransferase